MRQTIVKKDVQKLVGRTIYAIKKDGTAISGKLVRISGNRLIVAPAKGKQVKVSALIPLVLFDLLAVGTAPYAGYGGYGYGGYGGGYGPGYGYGATPFFF
jgi:hypothetical protein